MPDVGLTHIALPCTDLDASITFYQTFAAMKVVHRRVDETDGVGVVWLSDHTRPFVLVLLETEKVEHALRPNAHLGVGCVSREEVDRLCAGSPTSKAGFYSARKTPDRRWAIGP